MPSAWTEARVQELMVLWSNGVDVIAIARQLQCSKGAVIGKADRLGMPQHAKYRRLDRPHQPQRHKPPSQLPPVLSWVEPRIVAVMELMVGTCRFPVDDGYCGAPTDGKSSYCDRHHRLAYITKSSRDMSQVAQLRHL
jgi:hypothetical protein